MASPSSKAELITYAKRQLGEPVLQVNVDDEQVNNVIDDFQFHRVLRAMDLSISSICGFEPK